MENKFKKSDVESLVKFLNLVATKAEWIDVKVKDLNEILKAYKEVQALIPKMEANILEVTKVIEPEKESEK